VTGVALLGLSVWRGPTRWPWPEVRLNPPARSPRPRSAAGTARADSLVRQDNDQGRRAAVIRSTGSQPAAPNSAARSLPPIPLGSIRDLTELLLGKPVRPAIRRERCQLLLIETRAEGVIGNLDLELVADGTGAGDGRSASAKSRKDPQREEESFPTPQEKPRRTPSFQQQQSHPPASTLCFPACAPSSARPGSRCCGRRMWSKSAPAG